MLILAPTIQNNSGSTGLGTDHCFKVPVRYLRVGYPYNILKGKSRVCAISLQCFDPHIRILRIADADLEGKKNQEICYYRNQINILWTFFILSKLVRLPIVYDFLVRESKLKTWGDIRYPFFSVGGYPSGPEK